MNKLKEEIIECKKALDNHGVICFPTETVMGLGVYYDDQQAYKKLNFVKCRPENKQYTLMVDSIKKIEKYAYINETDKKIIKKFMPGSITIIFHAKKQLPIWVSKDSGTIGIRIPTNKEAIKLLKQVDRPLLVPSANVSGCAPAKTYLKAKGIFGHQIDGYISIDSKGERPSTIISLTDGLKLVREGPISFEKIKRYYK